MATTRELLDEHNALAIKLKQPTLASWKQSKDKLEARIRTLKARSGETIGGLVKQLLMTEAPYDDIVAAVKGEFPEAKTTRRSVASTAADMRKAGLAVPKRKKGRRTA